MNADRNLLFGIMCVQAGFVRRDGLIEAMTAWTLAKHRPLGGILKERGDLAAAHHDLVAALVEAQLAQHGGDAVASLAALESATPTKDALRAVADADVQASLGATVTEIKPTAAAAARAYADRDGCGRFRIVKPHAKGGLLRRSLRRRRADGGSGGGQHQGTGDPREAGGVQPVRGRVPKPPRKQLP